MYLKVLVMEIKENYCLVMTQDGEILRIKRKKDMKVGDQIFILQEDLYQGESEEQPVLQKKIKTERFSGEVLLQWQLLPYFWWELLHM